MIPDAPAERIAFVRTVAPLLWSLLLTQLVNAGIELDTWLADQLTVDEALVNGVATVVVAVALWVAARLWPAALERVLMLIPVDEYAYTRDEDLVTSTGRVDQAASVIRIGPGSEEFVQAFLGQHPSEITLRSAAARLLDAAEDL